MKRIISKYSPPPLARLAAVTAALVAMLMAGPVWAQVSGPILVDPNSGQQTYGGNTTDPDFSPLTPEQQNWNANNLSIDGTGTSYVGSLERYEVNAGERVGMQFNVNLRWTPPPSQNSHMVGLVEYEFMGGRRSGSQPMKVMATCPEGTFSDRLYGGRAPTGMLNLEQMVSLTKCSKLLRWNARHRDIDTAGSRDSLLRSVAIRLKGKVVMLDDGGYVASFGPHDSAWDCGPPTWPSAAHQAAGHPPYAEWCDLSIYWRH